LEDFELKEKIKRMEDRIGYSFIKHDLVVKAMTHSSYSNEKKSKKFKNNERLEFLGDSVLSIIVSEYLFHKFSELAEGELTKVRSKLVCEATLSSCARDIGIGDYLILGKGEEITGGRDRSSILADAFEALIAAIYLDGGIEEAKRFVLKEISKFVGDAINGNIIQDYKTYLQEVVQVKKENKLTYDLYKSEGPDHCKTFYINVELNDRVIGTGTGKSKKEAEQSAARKALEVLKSEII
jgi:ribonuclease III